MSSATAADFPDWVPAMLVKELRQGLRTRAFVVVVIGVQAVMALAMLGAVHANAVTVAGGPVGSGAATFANGLFWTLLGAQLLVIAPARAISSLQTEIATRGIDLLLLSRLSAWRIVLGKWFSCGAQSALLLIAMLPYGIVRYFAGSTDLVGDARLLGALFAASLLLAAVALWSALGARLMFRLGLALAVPLAIMLWMPFYGRFHAGMPLGAIDIAVMYLDAAALTLFFLASSVQRIAPPSENHAPLIRGIAWLPVLLVAVCFAAGLRESAERQFIFAAIFVLGGCAIEMSVARFPPARLWRDAQAGRSSRRIALAFGMPGWPSALIYGLAAVALLIVFAAWWLRLGARDFDRLRWSLALAYGAAVAPTAVLVAVRGRWGKNLTGPYFGVLIGMSLLAAIASALNSASPAVYSSLVSVVRVLPISSFWMSLNAAYDASPAERIMQLALIAAAVVAALARSKPYWQSPAE